jgi:hypothetical protein
MRGWAGVAFVLVVGIFAVICGMSCERCYAQVQSPPPNLKKLSDEQLTQCYDDAKVCGTADAHAISEELSRRIPEMTTDQLVACFANWHICGTREGEVTGLPISDEIARRGNPVPLMVSYWKVQSPAIRAGIEHVAAHFDIPQALTFMQEVFAKRMDDGEDLYFPANYLARRRCDPDALKLLSSGKSRSQGCVQFESTVKIFGECKYRPAIPYLVDSALSDLCENIVDSAAEDLRRFYPKGPQTFDGPEDAQKFYCGAAKKEGFAVTCTIPASE